MLCCSIDDIDDDAQNITDWHNEGTLYLQIAKWTGLTVASEGCLYALILAPTEFESQFRHRGIAQIPEENGFAEVGWEQRTVQIT